MSQRVKKCRVIRKIMRSRKQQNVDLSTMKTVNYKIYGGSDNNVNNKISGDFPLNNEYNYDPNINSEIVDDNSLLSDVIVDDCIEALYVSKNEVRLGSEVENDGSDYPTVNESVIEENNTNSDSLQEKLRQWALKNLANLQLNVISELLVLLRDEGHQTLPKIKSSAKHCPKLSSLRYKYAIQELGQ